RAHHQSQQATCCPVAAVGADGLDRPTRDRLQGAEALAGGVAGAGEVDRERVVERATARIVRTPVGRTHSASRASPWRCTARSAAGQWLQANPGVLAAVVT